MTVSQQLQALGEESYAAFQRRLIPTVAPETILGVRTPALRALAKTLPDPEKFRQELPHRFFEENQLHAFSVEGEKDFSVAVSQVNAFLPYIDNWATCDQLRPKCFARHKQALLPHIQIWLASEHVYTQRFAVGMLLVHFLDGDFQPEFLSWVANTTGTDYYNRMMVAWYFATALAKQYDATVPYLTERKLDTWVHNKTIQKAVESNRISPSQKEFLRTLRKKTVN